jgi:hypothetical protein
MENDQITKNQLKKRKGTEPQCIKLHIYKITPEFEIIRNAFFKETVVHILKKFDGKFYCKIRIYFQKIQ